MVRHKRVVDRKRDAGEVPQKLKLGLASGRDRKVLHKWADYQQRKNLLIRSRFDRETQVSVEVVWTGLMKAPSNMDRRTIRQVHHAPMISTLVKLHSVT